MDNQNNSERRYNGTDFQMKFLLGYTESHTNFAEGRFVGDPDPKATKSRIWKEVTEFLNLEGNLKTISAWQKFWNTLKADARHQNAVRNASKKRSGNPDGQIPNIDDNYRRVINIVGKSHGNGLSLIPELGFR